MRHCAPLIDALAKYAVVSDKLPFPSQERLARDCGVHPRTICRWLAALEALGVIEVFRSKPRCYDGKNWSRPTNRYLLTDRKATRTAIGAPSSPVRRRRNITNTTPVSSKPYRYESGVGARRSAPPLTPPEPTPAEPVGSPTPPASHQFDLARPTPAPSTGIADQKAAKDILAETRAKLRELRNHH